MNKLEIVSETTLATIPRGNEELRVTRVVGKSGGKETSWHSLRVFWKGDDGQWRPGKQGLTVRSGELEAVLEALGK